MDTGILYGCITPHPPILVPSVAGSRLAEVGQTRAAMKTVAIDVRCAAPDVAIVISPHAPISPWAMSVCSASKYLGGFEDFGVGSPQFSFEGDQVLASAVRDACQGLKVPVEEFGRRGESHRLDHGAAVPLYFLAEAGVRCKALLLAFSDLDVEMHHRFGGAIAQAVLTSGRRAVLVASGDLSHRLIRGAPAGYSPVGKQFDSLVVHSIESGDWTSLLQIDDSLRRQAGECGYRSVVIASGAMPHAVPELLSYEGPFGVGYMVARLQVPPARNNDVGGAIDEYSPEPDGEEAAALGLAREAVETYVRRGRIISPPREPRGLLAKSAGVFVSLKAEGCLRGCIGTYSPMEPCVAAEIVRNAVAAASRDPRFAPVALHELSALSYSIDVLSAPVPIPDESHLDPKRYGVIVQAGGRKGLLLPDLAGVDTTEAQVEIARRKAGIAPGEPVKLWRFTVTRISE